MTAQPPLPERIARILDRHNSSFRSDSLVGSAVRNVETTKQINLLLAEEVVGELKKICQDNWQKPIPEQYMLDRIKELTQAKDMLGEK